MGKIPPADSLVDRTSRAAAWVSLQSVVTKLVAFLSQIVLARFLLSEDFGLYAMAMTVYSLAGMLHQAGLQEVLIKRQRAFRVWANAAFWMSLATGFGACLLMMAVAPLAAKFYTKLGRPEDLVRLMTILAFAFPLASAGAVCRARLQIDMRFRDLAVIGTIQAVFDVVLKISLAWQGFGAFSFGYASVLSSALYLAMCWVLAPVPIKWSPQLGRWRYLVGDGAMVTGTLVFYWLIEEGDYLVLGRFEGERVVGLYFLAYKISRHTMMLLTLQLSRVLFPALSQLPPEAGRQASAFVRATRMLILFSTPCCVGMALVATPLIKLVFLPEFYPVARLTQIMALGMALRTLCWPASSLLLAQGRFRTRMWLSVFSVFVFFPLTIVGAWLGSAQGLAIAVAIFFVASGLVDLATALWPAGNVLASISGILRVPLLANAIASVPAIALSYGLIPRLGLSTELLCVAQIASVLLVGAAAYAALIRLLAPTLWHDAGQRLQRLIPVG